MIAISFKENNIEALTSFMQTDEFEALSTEEKAVLIRYADLEQSGKLNSRTVVQISQYYDPTYSRGYSGGGTVKEVADANYTDGVELKYFMVQRPYLFFANPETHEFYFMKNPSTLADDITALEVLDVSARQWVRIDALEPFFGRPPTPGDSGTSANVNAGLILTHFCQNRRSKIDPPVQKNFIQMGFSDAL